MTSLHNAFRQDLKHQFCRSHLFEQLGADVQDVLIDLLSLSWQLNGSSGRTAKLDSSLFHEICILIGYRLVDISPLRGPRPVSRLENALHLGLMAFMTTFMAGLNRRVPHFHLLPKLARAAARGIVAEDTETRELLLWISFIQAVTIFEQADELWLLPIIKEITLNLGLHTWDDVCQTLFKFPWVKPLHNKPGEVIWQRSRFHDDSPSSIQHDKPPSTTNFR